jgi:cell division protein ZapE
MAFDPAKALDAYLAEHAIVPDAAQRAVLARLNALSKALTAWQPTRGRLGSFFAGKSVAPQGVYIHGKVGRGKTMLMDAFFATAPIELKRRVHFHAFMSETHTAIGTARHDVPGDPIPHVAKGIAERARLLCFDEFHITDIADAMILGRLFRALFEHGVVVVATSNVAPSGLYRNGLNRDLFEPFIALLETRLDVVELDAVRDYRLDRLMGRPLYFTPLGPDADAALREAFLRLTGFAVGEPRDLDVDGRKVRLPEVAEGTVFATFEDLCAKPLGARDYLKLAATCHTLILANVPVLHRERRTEARRFITLIDTLYDARTRLIVSAEAEPDALHPAGDEAFLFERTASRLQEMRSADYLAATAIERSGHTV